MQIERKAAANDRQRLDPGGRHRPDCRLSSSWASLPTTPILMSRPFLRSSKTRTATILFTRADIMAGQGIFLGNGLMEYGSIFGHGAYLGPDFTAEYLHRAALSSIDFYGGANSDTAGTRTIHDFKTNRYDETTGTLTYTDAQAQAFEECQRLLRIFLRQSNDEVRPSSECDPRPGTDSQTYRLLQLVGVGGFDGPARHSYSYTNNWPPEPLVDNHATADAIVWSMLSLAALLGGTGLLLATFGRWNLLGWHGREQQSMSFRAPDEVLLTPAQNACAWFFFVMAALFLVQTLLGGASEHYRADLQSFFGIDLGRLLPFNIVRTWHVQLSIFWVSTSYLAAGIFLAPMIAGREPRGQKALAYGLLGALVIVVVGSLLGEFAGIQGLIHNAWFGDQGFEYLDLGRVWQILLTIGLLFWVVILYRGLRGRLGSEHVGNMPWLFFFSALSIPAFYGVGLLANRGQHFTTTDFWRFWVVHLWVEDFLELFTTILVAYIFVLAGSGARAHRAANDLSRRHSVLCRRHRGHHASCVLLGRTGAPHGSGSFLFRGRSDTADLSDGGSMEFPAIGNVQEAKSTTPFPALLGRDVSGSGRLLELSWAPESLVF